MSGTDILLTNAMEKIKKEVESFGECGYDGKGLDFK